MEAKDTVIKKRWMSIEVALAQNKLLLDQAEITWDIAFKAGHEDGFNFRKAIDRDALIHMKREGIKEVVEWVDALYREPTCIVNGPPAFLVHFWEAEWQAKLKEWGLEQSQNSHHKPSER